MSNSNLQPDGIAWGRVCGAAAGLAVVLGGIWYATTDAAEPPKPQLITAPMQARTRTVVPGYETHQPPQVVQQAALTPNAGLGGLQQGEQKAAVPPPGARARPREKSYREKLWEAHLEAGPGGADYEAENAKAGIRPVAQGASGGCMMSATLPITVQVQNAGYTERGGMIHAVVVQPALGDGMDCTVLPVGSRATMEFWGEIGESDILEVGRPVFAVPKTALTLHPAGGLDGVGSNGELPDYQSGWVRTPTFSLDSGDTVILHLRGNLHATPRR